MRLFVVLVLLLPHAILSASLDYCEGCRACLLGDAETGAIIYQKNADKAYPVGSIVKTMLELIVAEKIKSGELSLDEEITTSRYASRMGGSQVYLKEGEKHTLEDMMKAIIIASANDATVAVAEHISGTVEGFVDLMRIKAEELGLEDSVFYTVHGLPDKFGREDLMSPRDIFKVARELVKYKNILMWSSIRRDKFRGGKFILYNTNKLLGRFRGLDGLKTGYTSKAKYCFVATAKRGDLRLIAVVLGCEKEADRFKRAARLLNYGFNVVKRIKIVEKGSVVRKIKVKNGDPGILNVIASDDLYIYTFGSPKIEKDIEIYKVNPPVKVGEEIGKFRVFVNGKKKGEIPLIAGNSVEKVSIIKIILRRFIGS